jgi:hypothetical protein
MARFLSLLGPELEDAGVAALEGGCLYGERHAGGDGHSLDGEE